MSPGLRVLVTGGASGIGAAVARRLLDGGAAVAVLDLAPDDAPDGAVPVVCDVADAASVRAAVDEAATALGGLDGVVANAGIGAVGGVADATDEDFARLFDVNVVGVARTVRAALPHLRASPSPAVVATGSIAGDVGLPARAAYTASKGAVHALVRSMAADLLPDGIRVNAVAPGTADTPWVQRLLDRADDAATERAALEARQPHGRLVTPDEVALAICWLLDPAAGSLTGTVLPVDGGFTHLRLPR